MSIPRPVHLLTAVAAAALALTTACNSNPQGSPAPTPGLPTATAEPVVVVTPPVIRTETAPEPTVDTTQPADTTEPAEPASPAEPTAPTGPTERPEPATDDLAPTPSSPRPFVAVDGFAPTSPTPDPTGPTGLANPTVPGEPLDFGPNLGRPLTIVGVEVGDELNFRVAPSPDADIVASYPITLTEFDMYALGEAWAAPTGVWWKVNVMGHDAWANQKYLGVRGGSAPIFDEVAAELQILVFESIEQGALAAAETRATVEPASRVVAITEPEITPLGDGGGVGSMWFDVLDIGDHLQKGERLKVEFDVVFDEATPEPNDIAFVVLSGVEMTFIQAM